MKKTTLRIAVLSLLAAVLAAGPTPGLAQEKKNDKATEEKKEAPGGEKKKKGQPPLNGKIAAVDKNAKTVTIGKTTIQITSETRIEKAGKPATLDEVAVGEPAVARVRKTDDGKNLAMSLRVGPRPGDEEKKGGEKKGEGKKKKQQQ